MKNLIKPWIFAALCLGASVLSARAQGPVFDPSFLLTSAVGHRGGAGGSDIKDMVRQPDGKLVVAGDFSVINGRPAVDIARLLPDGQVDTTFTAPLADGEILSIALQADGKLLVGGYFTTVGGQSRIGIARLLPTGALDPGFLSPLGGGPPFAYSNVQKIVLQPGKGILLLGALIPTNPAPGSTVYAARLLEATGARDATFQPGFNTFYCYDVLVLPGGRLVFAGTPHLFNGQTCTVWGTLPDGALDPAFAPLPSTITQSYGLALDPPTGNIYVASGTAGASLDREPVRLLPNGVRDPAFSTAGTFVAGSTFGGLNGLAVQPNGRVLLGGFVPVAGGGYTGTARLLPSGALDPSYQAGNGPASARKVLALPDGALLFCGSFHQVGSLPVDCLARMLDPNVLGARAAFPGDELAAWPVPAREELHVRLAPGSGPLPVALLDALGREVRRRSLAAGQQALTLPTAGLPAGCYLLQVAYPSGPVVRRVLVE